MAHTVSYNGRNTWSQATDLALSEVRRYSPEEGGVELAIAQAGHGGGDTEVRNAGMCQQAGHTSRGATRRRA